MDEQTKKKVLIGVLAALILGMGTYYFVLRDDGSVKRDTGPVASTRREKAPVDPRSARETARPERAPEEVSAEEDGSVRREREEDEEEGSQRRKSRTEEGKVKRKEIKPAA